MSEHLWHPTAVLSIDGEFLESYFLLEFFRFRFIVESVPRLCLSLIGHIRAACLILDQATERLGRTRRHDLTPSFMISLIPFGLLPQRRESGRASTSVGGELSAHHNFKFAEAQDASPLSSPSRFRRHGRKQGIGL